MYTCICIYIYICIQREALAVQAVLISTVRKNTEEPTGLWGNGSYLISICSTVTTGIHPRVKCVCCLLINNPSALTDLV